MRIRAVAVDLDGTLAGTDHRVSQHALRVLAELQRQGITAIIVTGRTERAATGIARAARLSAPVVSCNGAVVSTPAGDRLRVARFDSATIEQVTAFSSRADVELVLWTASAIYASKESESTALLQAVNAEVVRIGQPQSGSIVKIMLGGAAERLDALSEEVSLTIPLLQRSMSEFYEASPPGADKWDALHTVLDQLGIDPGECIGFGDGDTDLDWMSRMGEAIAVENARAAVLEIATAVIGHHGDDAVADYLHERFLGQS